MTPLERIEALEARVEALKRIVALKQDDPLAIFMGMSGIAPYSDDEVKTP